MEWFSTALISIIGTLVASYGIYAIQSWYQRRTIVGLVGVWIETFESTDETGFAIAKFSVDLPLFTFRYDGTRFKPNGEPVYSWESKVFCVDTKARVAIYTYKHYYEKNGNNQSPPSPARGLGMIRFDKAGNNKGYTFTYGEFSDRDSKQHTSVVMERLQKIIRDEPIREPDNKEERVKLGPIISKLLPSRP